MAMLDPLGSDSHDVLFICLKSELGVLCEKRAVVVGIFELTTSNDSPSHALPGLMHYTV